MTTLADLLLWVQSRPKVPYAPYVVEETAKTWSVLNKNEKEEVIADIDKFIRKNEAWAEEGEALILQFQKQLLDFADLIRSQGYTEEVDENLTKILGGQKQK